MLRQPRLAAVVLKDLKVAARRPSMMVAGAAYTLLASAVASTLSLAGMAEAVVNPLVLVAVFNAVFVSSISFLLEEERGLLDHYPLYRVGPYALYASKMALTLVAVESLNALALALARIAVGSHVDPAIPLILALGVYLAAASTLSSLISVYLEARSMLLPAMVTVLSAPAAMTVVRPFAGLDVWGKSLVVLLVGVAYSIVALLLAGRLLRE